MATKALGRAGWWCAVLLSAGLSPCHTVHGSPPVTPPVTPPASPAVVRLLAVPISTPAAARADLTRLAAARSAWAGTALGRLLVEQRRAADFGRLGPSDSVLTALRRAHRAARLLARAYPLEVAGLEAELANWHWSALNLDSAGYYFRAAAMRPTRAGYDLRSPRLVPLADGRRALVGAEVASRWANAGLVDRRRGDLPAAVRRYEQAATLYQAQSHQAGLRWTQCLLGEAYEDEGDDASARAAYERAWASSRTLPAPEAASRAGQLTDLARYYADLLLRHGQASRLLALVTDGLRTTARARQLASDPAALADFSAELSLTEVEAWLSRRRPDSAAAALRRADYWLHPGGRTLSYADEGGQLLWHCLAAQVARQQGAADEQRAHLRQALAVLPRVRVLTRQALARERLGAALTELGEGVTAARVLTPLEALYHQQNARLKLRDLYALLEAAYARAGRADSTHAYAQRYRRLDEALRTTRQYAALAAIETRYRTREQAQRLRQLAEIATREQRQKQLAWVGAALLAAALVAAGWALHSTRRLNRRMSELDHLKDQFFANVSHELRTPLTLMVGPAEHLLTDETAPLPAAAQATLRQLVRNGQRLQQLVNRLLDFAKLESGRLRPEPTIVSLALVVEQVVSSFEPLAAVRGIRLQAAIAVPPARRVRLDADKLEQIVSNLLANALRFTPAGGSVRLSLTPDEAPDRWRLTVRDTGPGIAPQEQVRVFERFYQSPQRQASGGTGIGLALARELAELLDGTLTLHSRLGEGSAFELAFRAEEMEEEPGRRKEKSSTRYEGVEKRVADEDFNEEAEAEHSSFLASHALFKPKVLVVEDHADLRAFLRQILAPRYEVLEAADGPAALALLATETVDLISSDEMMPGMSGTELFAALRAKPGPAARVPFLLLTARADVQHRLAALELGVDDYLHKPFLPRELLARAHNLIANYHERQAAVAGYELPTARVEAGPVAAVDPRSIARPGTAAAQPVTVSKPETRNPKPDTSLADQDLLRRFRALAEADLTDPTLDVARLVTELGVSERSLYRRVRELTGLTPAAYLRETRLDRARQLLEQRAYPTVAEVAYAVGFDNPGYFATVFYKRYGKRATEYL